MSRRLQTVALALTVTCLASYTAWLLIGLAR